jgi:hypothetical protein
LLRLGPGKAQAVSLRLAVGHHAGFHGQSVLAKAFSQRSLGQQSPGGIAVKF